MKFLRRAPRQARFLAEYLRHALRSVPFLAKYHRRYFRPFLLVCLLGVFPVQGADLTLELDARQEVRFVGALTRWDADGGPRHPVDPHAAIDAPRVDAEAQPLGDGRWVFRALPPGRYDLVLLTADQGRVEGFHYPPVREFDPFLPGHVTAPDEAREAILRDLERTRHFENKVSALFLGGDERQVRLLMQLVRDQPTSFDGDFGSPVATIRHEVWQYDFRYGTWSKERRTRILDRLLMAREDLDRWTWVWVPELGGIEIGSEPLTRSYALPERFAPETARGWFPEPR